MKTSELRIGNWVYNDFTREDIEVYPMMIHRLSKMEGEHHIKPIPLTEEWLIKFGFKLREPDEAVYIIYGVIGVGYDRYTQGWALANMEYPAKCEYVHTLQNLYFALTGEELTIKKR